MCESLYEQNLFRLLILSFPRSESKYMNTGDLDGRWVYFTLFPSLLLPILLFSAHHLYLTIWSSTFGFIPWVVLPFNKFCFSSFFFVQTFISFIGFFYLHLSHLCHLCIELCPQLFLFTSSVFFSSLVSFALVICSKRKFCIWYLLVSYFFDENILTH